MAVVPTIGPVVPAPSYHLSVAIDVPDGVKRHASLLTSQLVSNPFLPGATTAAVPVAFCRPTIALPSFHGKMSKLSTFFSLINTSITLVFSYKTIIPVYKIELFENIGTLFHEATNALQPVFRVISSQPT